MAIVGAGPTGLALALGLARLGVSSTIVEKEAATSEYSKAPGIHIRTREVFRQWGVEERFLEAGVLAEVLTLHDASNDRRSLLTVDFRELADEADRPGLLILEQGETERLLLEAVRETGFCDALFDTEAVALAQKEDHVSLTVRENGDERRIRAGYAVGCDGASSFVRDALELPFDGITYRLRPMLADVRIGDARDALPWPRVVNSRDGYGFIVRLRAGLWRIVHLSPRWEEEDHVPREELEQRVSELLGEGPFEVVWSSRFRIHRRSAPHFRVGRVLLAGDAAHVHSPVGGMGMNAGIQDARNLAWKLAAAMRGGDTDRLLDSYDVERRAVVVESVSRYTDLLTRTFLQTPRRVRELMFVLLRGAMRLAVVRRRMLRRTAMIDLRYPDSPLLDGRERSAGARLPNPLLRSPAGRDVRLYDLLPPGPVLLELSPAPFAYQDLPAETVIRIGPGAYVDPAGLLQGLLEEGEGWILVRPDAHIVWARSELRDLDETLERAMGGAVATDAPEARRGTAG